MIWVWHDLLTNGNQQLLMCVEILLRIVDRLQDSFDMKSSNLNQIP